MADLVTLWREMDEAREQFDAISVANTAGLTPEQRVELDLAYRRVAKRYQAAWTAYYAALEEASR